MAIRSVPDYSRPVYDILGLPFDAVDLQGAVRSVIQAVENQTPLFISTPNLNFLIASQSDASFRQSVQASDLSLADGMPVIWLARLLGVPVFQRVAGSDLFEALCAQTNRTVKVYFFGGPDGAAQQASDKVNAIAETRARQGLTPGVRSVGFESPGFGTLDDMSQPTVIERINATGADFVVVALGAKKGQAWIQRNREQLHAPVISHLGAVVNMAAGTIARAPKWMQRIGLEWVWRIKEEPMLWKRYASDGWMLLRLLLTQIVPQMAWRMKLRWRGPAQSRDAALDVRRDQGVCHLALRGIWTDSHVQPFRDQLTAAAKQSELTQLDIRGASYLAPAVRGLIAIASRGKDAVHP
jgi:N-acetylglucosaminyldiphosphoundecaprenol N-acetyl-beta-D-mannosaminyltransferase